LALGDGTRLGVDFHETIVRWDNTTLATGLPRRRDGQEDQSGRQMNDRQRIRQVSTRFGAENGQQK
jgi:hypothetical protein